LWEAPQLSAIGDARAARQADGQLPREEETTRWAVIDRLLWSLGDPELTSVSRGFNCAGQISDW
jgi:hypothetical protein